MSQVDSKPSLKSLECIPSTQFLYDDSNAFQVRQFEYHPDPSVIGPVVAVGTVRYNDIEPEVIVLDWEKHSILKRLEEPGHVGQNENNGRVDEKSVLAIAWLHRSNKFLAASSDGNVALYTCDTAESDHSATHKTHDFGKTRERLTSVHINSTNSTFSVSGYTTSVELFDLETCKSIRTFDNIHSHHINISRFANSMPFIFATCSFDKKLKLWDSRCDPHVSPIFSATASAGYVMLTFSPDDRFILSSAIDNEVVQRETVDGRLNQTMEVPKLNSSTNYTRSYYTHDGNSVLTGSAGEDILRQCDSVTGEVISSARLFEGRTHPSLFVQSLRGNPTDSSRCGVLVCYRHFEHGFQLIDVDLKQSEDTDSGRLVNMAHLSTDFQTLVGSGSYSDIYLKCSDGEQINAHRVILENRWPWFKESIEGLTELATCENDSDRNSASIDDDNLTVSVNLPKSLVVHVLEYLYTESVSQISCSDGLDLLSFTGCKSSGCLANISGFVEKLSWKLKDSMTVTECVTVFLVAQKQELNELADYCADMIASLLDWFMQYQNLASRVSTDELTMLKELCSKNALSLTDNPNFMGARHSFRFCRLGEFVYVIGGYYRDGVSSMGCITVLSLRSDSWSLCPTTGEYPQNLNHHTACVVGVSIFCYGGSIGDADFISADWLYELHIPTMRWSRHSLSLAPTPANPIMARCNHAATVVHDRALMFVHGGMATGGQRLLGDLLVIDLRQKTVEIGSSLGDAPPCTMGHSLTYVPSSHCLVLMGGVTAGVDGVSSVRDLADALYIFDLDKRFWRRIEVIAKYRYVWQTSSLVHLSRPCDAPLPVVVVLGGYSPSWIGEEEEEQTRHIRALDCERWRWLEWTLERESESEPISLPARVQHGAFLQTSSSVCVWGGIERSDWRMQRVEFDLRSEESKAESHEIDGRQSLLVRITCPIMRVTRAHPEPVIHVAPSTIQTDLSAACQWLAHDLSDTESADNDTDRVVFVVEGHLLPSSRALLSSRCSHFARLFESGMRDARTRRVTMEDVRWRVFAAMLKYAMDGRESWGKVLPDR
eukprot:705183_1